jgi:hypothetical protein
MDMPLLTVTLSRSVGLAAALAVVHGLAGACAVVYLPAWGWTGVLAALAAGLVYHLRRHAWLTAPGAITGFSVREDGSCQLYRRDGSSEQGALAASTFVSAWLVTLVVRLDAGSTRGIAVLPDSAPSEARRRLRAWLRLRLAPPASART